MSFAAMLVMTASALAQSGGTSLIGDVNEDGTVDVADINAIIAIMKNVQEHYFYLGTTKPTAENYKIIPGTTTSFATLDEAVGTTIPVDAGQTLYMLCSAEWTAGKTVAVKDDSGETISFSEDVDVSTVFGYAIYKTQAWSTSSDATLITCPVVEMPMVELQLEAYWDYQLYPGTFYDWQAEWHYGWDDTDRYIFGELGYTAPTNFQLRCYYTGNTPMGTRINKRDAYLQGNTYRCILDWGYWDILAWSDVQSPYGIQNVQFNESLESVTAYTNRTRQSSYYEPEQLFSAMAQGIEISQNPAGYEYDEENNLLVKKLNLMLEPVTYIYLPQIIIHNNRGRIMCVSGSASLSGMARSTDLCTGIAGEKAVAVSFDMRMKTNIDVNGETVDIIGGRLNTFGICGQNCNRVSRADEINDTESHLLEVEIMYSNGKDDTLVFDVTEQVRRRYKGGVITVELDMDTIPMH